MVTLQTQISELDLDNFDGQLTQTTALSPLSWQTYRSIVKEMGDHRSTRLAYSEKTLTIKMPSKLHEIINRLLARIVTTLTEELNLDVVNIGSTTLDNDNLEKGAEPDTGFYIQNANQLEGLDPDIPTGLPPDLVIEVDITSPSAGRLLIYRALGVQEVWQYTKRKGVSVLKLVDGEYTASTASGVFPRLSAEKINQFLSQRRNQSENQVIRAVRNWVQSLESLES